MYAGQAGRTLTTHTGSLPRPPELAQALASRETGAGPVPPAGAMASMVADAVTEVTGRQAAIGIDIVSDGEVGKIGYSTYVKERLSGFGGDPGTLALADLDDHPAFTERALAGLVTQMPSCDGPVSYTGKRHDWYGIPAADASTAVEVYLICWLVAIGALTLATLRMPSSFTLLFGLVDLALVLLLIASYSGSAAVNKAGGWVVMAFVAEAIYIYFHVMLVATGGKGLPMGRPLLGSG